MPFADPERAKAYDREYKALKRAGSPCPAVPTSLPPDFKARTAAEVVDLLADELNTLRATPELGAIARAKTVACLAGVLLKAIETANVAARLEALEAVLKSRPKQKVA